MRKCYLVIAVWNLICSFPMFFSPALALQIGESSGTSESSGLPGEIQGRIQQLEKEIRVLQARLTFKIKLPNRFPKGTFYSKTEFPVGSGLCRMTYTTLAPVGKPDQYLIKSENFDFGDRIDSIYQQPQDRPGQFSKAIVINDRLIYLDEKWNERRLAAIQKDFINLRKKCHQRANMQELQASCRGEKSSEQVLRNLMNDMEKLGRERISVHNGEVFYEISF